MAMITWVSFNQISPPVESRFDESDGVFGGLRDLATVVA